MLKEIQGLHHVTSLAANAKENNQFFTGTLGLRRVKKTVNFDAPEVYHLYYGDGQGTPGTVMTYFPFPNMQKGRAGVGEVATTAFSIPQGSLDYWKARLSDRAVPETAEETRFGEKRISFNGPDGEHFALVETSDDDRAPWLGAGIPDETAIRGFHSASMRVRDKGAMGELLGFMNYQIIDQTDGLVRLGVEDGNEAHIIDLEIQASARLADQGAGSVHHIAFSVADRDAQSRVRSALLDTGYAVTPVIDRDYFWAIYFRTPDGILFEVATDEPGFTRDEDMGNLGEALKLPSQHEHLREMLQKRLDPIE